MARVPLIGRLFWREYLALFGSLILVTAEIVVRIITLALPQPLIRFFYNASRALFNSLSSQKSKQARSKNKIVSHSIANCSDFTDLCALWGYYAEEHIVRTKDDYLLGVHRLPFKKGEEQLGARVNAGPDSISKPVVYLHHGLLMNSEIWVCLTEEERCLPFALASQGYDVWLGNNRGNKYSKKSTKLSPSSLQFWDFSIDEFAFHDIPDTISYILKATGQQSLSYIGFSQGTAQAFATLAIHPALNDKINLFIALAPAMSPAGLSNGIVDALVKASPDIIFLVFGRKSILSSATMWQSILYPPIFSRLIDVSLTFLFGWHSRNITAHQKLAAYPHLYSFTSVKCVVHWFQIIRNKCFQMYDDDSSGKMSISAVNRYYKPAKFPTRNIKTPIVLVYGGSDSLVDIRIMLKELPRHTIATEISHFEHLDFLWAQDVDKLVFPHIFESLKYTASHPASSVNGTSRALGAKIGDVSYKHRYQNNSTASWSEDETSYSDIETPIEEPARPIPGTKSFAQQERERPYLSRTPSRTLERSQYSEQSQSQSYTNTQTTPSSPTASWVAQQRIRALDHNTKHDPDNDNDNDNEIEEEEDEQQRMSAPSDTRQQNGLSTQQDGSPESHMITKKRSQLDLADERDRPKSPASLSKVPRFGSKGISVGASRPMVGERHYSELKERRGHAEDREQ